MDLNSGKEDFQLPMSVKWGKFKIMRSVLIASLLGFFLLNTQAQEFNFGSDQWEITSNGAIVEGFDGKNSLYLFQGKARLKDFEFFTGILEYDIFISGRRGFPGIHFRMQDDINYEEFYVRPHQSGNPDANQYTPVFNGNPAWQLYYGERFSTAYAYKMNQWNHVRLVIAESAMEVYINDMDTPMLVVDELKHAHQPGAVELQAGGPSGFRFANFRATKMATPQLRGTPEKAPVLPPEIIKNWSVSNAFSEQSLDKVYHLDRYKQGDFTWSQLEVEERGYLNLSRLARLEQGKNTVFVRVNIQSDSKQVKALRFGVSDRGRVYLNGNALAGSNNNYASQDYRHLGTIGLFDEVYLPLKKGDNELWIAVSESFGGWGVMAAFEDMQGIKLR